jgi:hypothetical protein
MATATNGKPVTSTVRFSVEERQLLLRSVLPHEVMLPALQVEFGESMLDVKRIACAYNGDDRSGG